MSLLLCSIHQKMRATNCLRESQPGSGIYVCTLGHECKGSGDQPTMPLSSTSAAGAMVVPGMFPAALAPASMSAVSATAGEDTVICALHGKARKANLCTQVLTDQGIQWHCTESKRCKTTTAAGTTPVGVRYSPYAQLPGAAAVGALAGAGAGRPMLVPIPGGEGTGNQYYAVLNAAAMWPGMMGAAGLMGAAGGLGAIPGIRPGAGGILADGVSGTCALHGKRRTLANLVEASPGLYRCKPGYECKVAH